MMKYLILSLLLIGLCGLNGVKAQIQWASGIKACSEDNKGGDFSPQKVLGQPDVTPNGKPSHEAWTILFPNGEGEAYIEVVFDKPMKVRKIFIAENIGIGLKTVILKDNKEQERETYSINENYDLGLKLKAKISHIILYAPTNYEVKSLKIAISLPFMGKICQIDGIGISEKDIALDYEQDGDKISLPSLLKKQALATLNTPKNIAEKKNITTFFPYREVSKYILRGKFVNDTFKINRSINLQLVNLNTNDSLVMRTEKDGSFQIGLDEAEYSLVGYEQDYLATPINKVSTVGKKINEIITLDIPIRRFKKGENYVFYEVRFEINSDSLNTQNNEVLYQILTTLQANPKAYVKIAVHTDARGDDQYNLQLTEKRADRIAQYLRHKGISPNRLFAKGLGETELRNQCANGVKCDNASHSENRRIEMEIIDYLK
jgi:outer membrane protein OmpA-like peptidoglycan-associated protein